MGNLVGTFTQLDSSDDKKSSRSILNQLVDVIQEDVSGSVTRRKYQVFVTGGIGPGVTSSLYQTVYDQDYSLQTSNPMFDMSVGLFSCGGPGGGGGRRQEADEGDSPTIIASS